MTTLNPIINFFLVALLYKYKLHLSEYIGLALGLAGGLVILKVWGMSLDMLLSGGNVYFILASFTWAVLSIVTAKSKSFVSPITYSLYLYGIGTVVSFCLALPYDVVGSACSYSRVKCNSANTGAGISATDRYPR